MARNTARLGRLRRVLNEDQSSIGYAYDCHAQECTPGDTPRYGVGANIENHPQVTDYIPRRMRVLGLLLLIGSGMGVLAELIAHQASLVPALLQHHEAQLVATRLTAWTSATAMLLTAAASHLIFLLKRHRIDDLKGRYRIWRSVTWCSVLLSANCIVVIHPFLGRMAGQLTGWQLLQDNSGWWLIPLLLIAGVLYTKLLWDAAECRSAVIFFLLSLACLMTSSACVAGWQPVTSVLWMGTISRSLPLAAFMLMLVGCLLTARYVVLDVQGLIEHKHVPKSVKPDPDNFPTQGHSQQELERAAPEDHLESAWIDGSQPEEDYDRPLSKAERKRLRKQQRHRAA